MDETFEAALKEKKRATLGQARQAARSALLEYHMEPVHMRLLQVSEHITFKVNTAGGKSCLLRIHSDSNRVEQILSEMEWLDALNREADLTVPEAAANRIGEYVTSIVTQKGLKGYVTLMRWVEGKHLKGDLTDGLVDKIGALLAKLHETSDRFVPSGQFARPQWGTDEQFSRDFTRLEQHYRNFLTDEDFLLYRQAAEKVSVDLAAIHKSKHDSGMIHADLHLGNLVFHKGEPSPIDFGRCGFGYYLYDIAQTLVGLYPTQRLRLMEAYAGHRRLHNNHESALECFFVMAILENYSFHAGNPAETESLKEQQPYAQAILQHYLSGSPFLFQKIPVHR